MFSASWESFPLVLLPLRALFLYIIIKLYVTCGPVFQQLAVLLLAEYCDAISLGRFHPYTVKLLSDEEVALEIVRYISSQHSLLNHVRYHKSLKKNKCRIKSSSHS